METLFQLIESLTEGNPAPPERELSKPLRACIYAFFFSGKGGVS